jgi:hypothetical protein
MSRLMNIDYMSLMIDGSWFLEPRRKAKGFIEENP